MRAKAGLWFGVAACVLVNAPTAQAQSANESNQQGEANEPRLKEIVVTASRRLERVEDVANTMSVFSGDDLVDFGINEPRDLAEQTPGLLTKKGPNGLAAVGFYMRGVGINDFTGTVDPSVGVYVDDVFKPTPDMLNFAVFDVDRVEVLKGPQGTLYGRNSTGGAVKFITRRPTQETEAFVRAGYSRFVTGELTGALSGPITDELLGRVSFSGRLSADDKGYSFNRTTGNTLGKDDSASVRLQLEWLPDEDFNARIIYNYGIKKAEPALLERISARDANDPSRVCEPILVGQKAEGLCTGFLGFFDPDDDPFDGESDVNPHLDIEGHDFTGHINWDLPGFTLTSVTGYSDFEKDQDQDIDASPLVIGNNTTRNEVEFFQQELRFTSDERWPVDWLFGGIYTDTDIEWFQNIDLSALLFPTSNGSSQKTEAWAVFGELGFDLTERLTVEGSVRFTNEERTWNGASVIGTFVSLDQALGSGAPVLSALPLPPGDPRLGGPTDFDNEIEENKVDFKASVKYRPIDDLMLFFTASEAFRSGGFSSAVIFSQEALEPFGTEDLRAYEGGLKYTSPGGSLRFNASGFYYDFEGFQATFVRGEEASARLQNAGDVRIVGVESTLSWLPAPDWTLDLGFSWLDNEIKKTEVVLQPLEGGAPGTIEGNEIPNAPPFSVNGRVVYETPQFANRLFARLQTDFNFVDTHFLEPNNRKITQQDSYFVLNGRVSLLPENERWEAAFWVRNLTDEFYRTAAQDLALSLGFVEAVTSQPRTYGLEVSYSF